MVQVNWNEEASMNFYPWREWGTHRLPGDLCPICADGRLQQATDTEVECDRCNARFLAGWRRHVYSQVKPNSISGMSTKLGPLYSSIQSYKERPNKTEPGQELEHIADLVFDIDHEDLEVAKEVAIKLTGHLDHIGAAYKLYFSGSKGFHVVVPHSVVGAEASTNLNHEVYKRIAQSYALELGVEFCMSIYSRSRLLRVPGTQHPKTGLYKTQLFTSTLVQSTKRLKEIAANPPKMPTFSSGSGAHHEFTLNFDLFERYLWAKDLVEDSEPSVKLDSVPVMAVTHPPCVAKAMLYGPPKPGVRHQLTLNMAAYFVGAGLPRRDFTEWAELVQGASNTPPHERVHDAGNAYDWASQVHPQFSCRVMQDLGLCDPNCPFYRDSVFDEASSS